MKLPRIILASTAVLGLAVTPAFAAAQDTPRGTIDINQYDLTTEKGAKKAYRAIKNSVEDVCEVITPSTGSRIKSELRACVKETLATTMATVEAPLVVAAYEKTLSR